MNRGIHRLVFNAERSGWVAVAETARSRGKQASRRRLALATLAAAVASAWAAPTLPPTPAAGTLPVPANNFVFAGSVQGGQPAVNAATNTMTIATPSRALGLNWQSFNIGSAATVQFVQPDATSRVLNRIGGSDPSQILGQLKANGQVYLINQNGIFFGPNSQVDVGGLVASALNLSESMANKLLNGGLPAVPGDRLEFGWDGSALGFGNGFVTVDAQAVIRVGDGGRVVLIAPRTVENLGLIEGGAGAEAILAAGGKVFLTAPDDPALRGLLVETQAFSGKDAIGNAVTLDGSASNRSDGTAGSNNGRIRLGTDGKVSLAALVVNQQGIINASRAINLNGATILVSGSNDTDRVSIGQRGDKAQIDWVSGLAVAAGKSLEFVQPSTAAVAYNHVYDPDHKASDGSVLDQAGRTTIDGQVTANGQLFLINEKGIAFGPGADVRAANFVASGLGISADLMRDGLFAQDVYKRAFFLNPTLAAATPDEAAAATASARDAFAQAVVSVAPGARIATRGENGFVMLFGSSISQGGTITTANGQTLLAAGADVYLKAPFAAGLRGFMAEVNPLLFAVKASEGTQWNVLDHGRIRNTGLIEAARGNITLVGYDLTQEGTLRSSTTATANGSIRLLARDQVAEYTSSTAVGGEPLVSVGQRNISGEGVVPYVAGDSYKADDKVNQPDFTVGRVGGHLTFGRDSVTEVVIDGSGGKTIAPDQVFVSSSIEAFGRKIDLLGGPSDGTGARLSARGGRIQFLANSSFDLTSGFAGDPLSLDQSARPAEGVGIFVGNGARLDVAGVTAGKSVADLFIEVELRGDEFANNPVQRNSILRGQKAWVDVRDGVRIADLSGWTGKIGQTVEEKAASGGTVSLRSGGSLVVQDNAGIDVSGGRVDYAAAAVRETVVLATNGKTYRLNDAPAAATYTDLGTVDHAEAAYSEGRSAGTVELVGHNLAVDGQLLAATQPGSRQRNLGDPAKDRTALPLGGKLIVRDAGQHFALDTPASASDADKDAAYGRAQIAFVDQAGAAAGLGADDPAPARLELSTTLVDAGFSRFDLQSDGRIDVPAGTRLQLPAGGEFKAAGRQVVVGGDLVAPGGSITLITRDMSQGAGPFPTSADARYSTLIVDAGATLSTAGTWINDLLDGPAATTALAVNGGKVSLTSAYDLDLRRGSRVDVSGGGRIDGSGKLSGGNAGSIVLSTGGMTKSGGFDFATDYDRRDASLFLEGTLAAYALGSGGKLEVNTSALALGRVFAADSRDWSRAERLAAGQVGAAFDSDFFNRGGFFEFKLVGRDGVTVADQATIVPRPLSWSLAGVADARYQASGSAIAGFARTLVLHDDQRSAPTRLSLGTRSLLFGNLTVGTDSTLGVSTEGSISLESWAQLTVLGTLEALGGSITLARPANRSEELYNQNPIAYSEAKQSESIYLGPASQLRAGGTVKLTAAARAAVEAGASADDLRRQERYRGEVLPGGSVELDAGLGYLITADGARIDVAGAAASLNAASASDFGTVTYALRTVGSAGGRVSLAAREGLFLDGSFTAAGQEGALGGIFSLRLNDLASNATWDSQGLPASMTGPRRLTLFQSAADHPQQWPLDATATYLAGKTVLPSATHDGLASLDLALLDAAGFGSWYLGAQDEVRFAGPIRATVANQLRLDAPVFTAMGAATAVNLTAAALQLGNSVPAAAPAVQADPGAASATFTARDIGVIGNFTWNGFAHTTLDSAGEIHFDSTANLAPNRSGGRSFSGQMTAAGDLAFAAARLSPSAYSDYRVDLSADPAARITISRPATAVAAPSLAAGGRLEFAAPAITHAGTVTAPLGEIAFSAPGGTVDLTADSVTSVAADRTLSLGQTDQSGRYWQYQVNYWNPGTKALVTTNDTVDQAPAKAIHIDGGTTRVASGARLDLAGGGEAIAAEFTPGPGGKTDILAASALAEPTTFAVLPGWNGRFAPVDSQALAYYNTSRPTARTAGDGSIAYTYDAVPSLKAGDQIRIGSDAGGLAAGAYTLLPARYALLPGAFLVTVQTASVPMAVARPQTDGTTLVAGQRLAVNADGSSTAYGTRPLVLEVASPTVVANRARYQVTTASDFFFTSSAANLPGDAGHLTAVGRSSLAFDPTVAATSAAIITAADGRQRAGTGLILDLAASKLLVSDQPEQAEAGWSAIDQASLAALKPASLLLGGTRSATADGTAIATVSSALKIVNGGQANADQALSAPELLLTAADHLTVTAGSALGASGSGTPQNLMLDGDGAFLRVAAGAQASVRRTGTLSGTRGALHLEADTTVAGPSVIVDATGRTDLDGTLAPGVLQDDGRRLGGALTIGAGSLRIVAGGGVAPAPGTGSGLTLSQDDLTPFAAVDQLRLTSYSTIDFQGDVRLGTPALKELVLAAAGLAGHGQAGQTAQVTAQSVVFANPNPTSAVFAAGDPGSGSLDVRARQITFADNVADAAQRNAERTGFAIRGFDRVNLAATSDLLFAGRGVTTIDNGGATAVEIAAGRVATVGTADHLFSASGTLTLTGGSGGSAADGLGGALELRGKAVDVAGRIETAAGTLTLAATGNDAGTDHVTLRRGALLAADGVRVAFADTAADAPAGRITLKAASGNIQIDAGAQVSVTAASDGGDAGTLALIARQGSVAAAAGSLRGSAAGTATQASLEVDAATVDLGNLADAVVETGSDGSQRHHFTGSWDLRRRIGDLFLAADKEIRAATVRLAADAGNIDIGGRIDASGAKGGRIELYANRASGDGSAPAQGGQVLLRSGSALNAYATAAVDSGQGSAGEGGTVIVGVSASAAADEGATGIRLAGASADQAAARIDVGTAAGSAAAQGRVLFSAPRIDTAIPLQVIENGLKTLTNTPLAASTVLAVVAASGSAGAYTLASTMASYQTGMLAVFKAPVANNASVTLNINSKGAKPLLKADGTPLAASSIGANQVVLAVYDGNAFRLAAIGQADTGTASAYAVALPSAPAALSEGLTLTFQAKTANVAGSGVTLTLNGNASLRASLRKEDGTALTSGYISANQLVTVRYTDGQFRVVRDLSLLVPRGGSVNSSDGIAVAIAAGTASAFTLASTMTSYQAGMLAVFKAPATNGDGVSLDVNGQGAKALLRADGSPLASGDIAANQVVVAVYDGSAFRLSATGQQDTGSGSAYAVALPVKPTLLTAGQVVVFQAKTASTAGSVTLTLNGDTRLRANLKKEDGSDLTAGYIGANQLVTAVYTGSEFRVVRDVALVAPGIVDSRLADVVLAGDVVGAATVQLQGVRTTRISGNATLDSKQQALLMARTAQAMATGASAVGAAADPDGHLGLAYQAGIDVVASGDITVANDWTFGSAKYAGAAGVLSLRAGGNLTINGTLNDGFTVTGTNFNELSRDARLLTSGNSWSYRLVAGADSGAAPLTTGDGAAGGNITVAANKLVRTGTGSIDLAAAGDIKLLDRAAVYTAGLAAGQQPDGFAAITSGTAANSIYSAFPTGGGDVSLQAGNRIMMTSSGEDAPALRHLNQWLFRAGGSARNLQWWPRIASFQQGVAAFGGGDIRLVAGGDIKDVTAAIPTNGRVPTLDGVQRPDLAVLQGGGDLTVRAGGAVDGGQFYVETGTLRLNGARILHQPGIALGNAAARIVARGDIDLGNVFNPLWTVANGYVYNVYGSGNLVSTGVSTFSDNAEYRIRIGTYGDATAVDLVSVAGNVDLGGSKVFYGVDDGETHMLAPARVKVAALNGSISGSIAQAPAAGGQLDLLAADAITLDTNSVKQLDVPASALPSLANPVKDVNFKLLSLLTAVPSSKHSATPWHQAGEEPSRLIALTGDISGQGGQDNYGEFSEPVQVDAGGAVRDLNLSIQHPDTSSVSTIRAGGAIVYTTNGGLFPSKGLIVHGPGRLELSAGGSVDLADSRGITSKGNLENPYLPEGGAAIQVLAGTQAPDYAAFLHHLQDRGLAVGDDTSPLGLRNRFFKLLQDYGEEAIAARATGGTQAAAAVYAKARAAIGALFPSTSVVDAAIDLFYSAIKTEQGGAIDLFAPGGGITVGIANPSSTIPAKKAAEQGLFTFRGGTIRAFARDSFLVNQSRVFTLDGGDILVWADRGNIDAGSGAKTVSATPPPVLVVRGGQIILDASNSVSGSGIGVLASRDDTPASDLYLFAPQGVIDAGDAGIRITGKGTFDAETFRNTTNIQAGGGLSGAPAPVVAAAPVVVTTPPAAADRGEAQAAAQVTAKGGRDAALALLTVELLGGDDGAAPGPRGPETETAKAKKKDPDKP